MVLFNYITFNGRIQHKKDEKVTKKPPIGDKRP
jgi:hypothetical protein